MEMAARSEGPHGTELRLEHFRPEGRARVDPYLALVALSAILACGPSDYVDRTIFDASFHKPLQSQWKCSHDLDRVSSK